MKIIAGLLLVVAAALTVKTINDQITDSVTQSVNSQITDAVTQAVNPNIEQSDRINGKPLPNKPSKTMFESRLITQDVTDATGKPTGWVVVTSRSVRDQGTRSPIHVHPHGGQTCVVSGEMSLYLDGEPKVQTAGPGDCYWMPAGRRMSGVNSADSRTIMIDTFVVPRGEQVWIVVEPGMKDAQDQFDKLFHTGH
jgi:quercetin dioxygenase-like cupin family protein